MALLRVSNDANSDFPKQDPAQRHRLILNGLDAITVRCKTRDPGIYKKGPTNDRGSG